MSKSYTFPCATVAGLTLAQKREAVKELRASIKAEVEQRRDLRALTASMKRHERDEKRALREAKKAERIAKLEAKLEALRNPVGAKAIKASRKPGPVKITKFNQETQEANEIAAKIKARKVAA